MNTYVEVKCFRIKMLLVICIIPVLLVAFLLKSVCSRRPKSINKKHVVITGGSSGIGKALAVLAAKQGANVTIVARNLEKLAAAKTEIESACLCDSQKVQTISTDVSNYEDVERHFAKAEKQIGPIFMLINCVGMAICGKVEDMDVSDVKRMIDINYYGTYFSTKVVVSKMIRRRQGIIVITGSQASLLGIFGYAAYAGSKFALRGFAEALDMEVKPYDISVTLALPADTDTPGYENENRSKLTETRLISEAGGIFQAREVAKKIMEDALAGNFLSHLGIESFLLTTLCVGMTPFSSYFQVIYQSLLLGPFKIISCFYLASFHRTIKKCTSTKST